eukprot:scaffold11555_cov63-Phaeocystis_antarctica.AAC.4
MCTPRAAIRMVILLRCLHGCRSRGARLEARAGLAAIGGLEIDAIKRRAAGAHLLREDPLHGCHEDALRGDTVVLRSSAPVDNRRVVPEPKGRKGTAVRGGWTHRGSIGGGPVSRFDVGGAQQRTKGQLDPVEVAVGGLRAVRRGGPRRRGADALGGQQRECMLDDVATPSSAAFSRSPLTAAIASAWAAIVGVVEEVTQAARGHDVSALTVQPPRARWLGWLPLQQPRQHARPPLKGLGVHAHELLVEAGADGHVVILREDVVLELIAPHGVGCEIHPVRPQRVVGHADECGREGQPRSLRVDVEVVTHDTRLPRTRDARLARHHQQ